MQTTRTSRHQGLGGLLAICALTLSGCASFTEVSRDERELHMVVATGVSHTMSIPALTAAAKEKAEQFCARQQMNAELRQLVRGWRPMQVELYFRCQPKDGILQALLN